MSDGVRMALGLLVGIVFGFLLQKGRVAKCSVIRGQFLLRDFTVMKVMLTAIVVGGAGVYAMHTLGLVSLSIKPLQFGAVVAGAAVFGIGMVVLGYCPGTALAAAAEGRRDSWYGLVGMLGGSMAFGEVYEWLTPLLKWNDWGKVTLPQLTGIPAPLFLAAVTTGLLLLAKLTAGPESSATNSKLVHRG